MSPLNYIAASLWQYRRTHLAVAAGVAVATAVITGALLVGDSVRGSLRDLVLERLGTIDSVLVAEQPFRADLAGETVERHLLNSEAFVPLLMIPGSMSATSGGRTEQATQLTILGVIDDFWKLGNQQTFDLKGDEAIITQAIANELHAKVGDEVILRVAVPNNIPADSTLGEKIDNSVVRRVMVKAIANEGIARFGLQPSQLEPRNIFVPLTTLQRLLDVPGKANVLAVNGANAYAGLYVSQLKPTLADFGLQVDEFESGGDSYVQLSAERLVLPKYVVGLAESLISTSWGLGPRLAPQATITYLANTINLGDKKVPYSTVTGIDSTKKLGPLRNENGEPVVLAGNEIALNDWTAERLGAKVGDTVTLKYYEPETTHGELVERTTEPLTIKLIVPLKDAEGNLTAAADEHFTPELPGVTDERSISDWDLPFKLVEKISREDEDYWDEYRTTPKAFVSLALAEKLWSTRWGTISALRWPATAGVNADSIQGKLSEKIEPSALGMKWIPIREQGLTAARGTTSFEGLFLGFSFFLMASAVMLIALLFRLGAENRAAEVGILAAVGWDPLRVRRIWLVEAALVAVAGAIVGAIAGVAYAKLMIHGLTTWWVAAVVTPFLRLHVNPLSLAIGTAVGVIVSLITIWWSLRKFTKLAPRQLLAGDTSDPNELRQVARKPKRPWLPIVMVLAAVGMGICAMFAGLRDEAQAGAFMGSGALVLAAMLIWLRGKLRQPAIALPSSLSLGGLAMRNARRKPSRTILSVGLAAVASFLIVALSAFRLAPTEGGTGGFDLMATSDLPVYFDLNTTEGRRELGFSDEDEKSFAGVEVASFRVRGGEDASCLNLYQTSQPRVVGMPASFDSDKFAWAGVSIPSDSPTSLPGSGDRDLNWEVLNAPAKDAAIPVVLDKNTAAYSLHLSGIGSRFTIRDAFDQEVTLEVVGLLAGSVLQGNILMSEANFLQLFPDSSGRKLFLIRNESNSLGDDELAALLETRLVESGFDAVRTEVRLAEFMAVQNTYLSTFQSLGALGLLMGTVGLAIAQLRSVVERRGELALLRSAGFNRRRLAELVLGENVSLLLAGLGCGTLAALVATLPHWAFADADIPWATLAVLLVGVALCGVAAGWLAVRAAIQAPLMPALRGD
jgi:ABC-type antimicrobial peptide transport system permease subunit